MIQDIGKNRFHNEYHPEKTPKAESKVLFYRGQEILVRRDGDTVSFLSYREVIQKNIFQNEKAIYLFSIDDVEYFLFCESEEAHALELPDLFPGYTWEKIDLLRFAEPKEASFAGVTGMQLFHWYRSRRFCPACGNHMVHAEKERMMQCEVCGQQEYPKICPAVIVGVTDKDRLLLTKYAGRSYTRYALIAGFAEIGETIEETVRREVMEEVGLKIRNLRYYKSQPWSFTDTLLFGFFAEVDGESEISLDETELSEGKWCTREEIPDDDGASLTREMMRVFKEGRVFS